MAKESSEVDATSSSDVDDGSSTISATETRVSTDDAFSDTSTLASPNTPTTIRDADALSISRTPRPDLTHRQSTTEMKLYSGNFLGDTPVPCDISDLTLSGAPNPRYRTEFSYIRYSALTCGPGEFRSSGYKLRAQLYEVPRVTRIMISLILRGEGIEKVLRTLSAIRNAIRALCARDEESWKQDSWKNVVLVVICDGEQDHETSALFAALGAWSADMIAKRVDGRRVTGDLYEYTSKVWVARSPVSGGLKIRQSPVPLQLLFCIREPLPTFEAQQWIVSAFGATLKPQVWVPVTVGDAPAPKYFYDVWATVTRLDKGKKLRRDSPPDMEELARRLYQDTGPVELILESKTQDQIYEEHLETLRRVKLSSNEDPATGDDIVRNLLRGLSLKR